MCDVTSVYGGECLTNCSKELAHWCLVCDPCISEGRPLGCTPVGKVGGF